MIKDVNIMIKRFEVKGFKNFKDWITLDFSDIRDYKFNSQCTTNNLLSKIIVYGKNSVGKTNIGLAIFDIVSHLTTKNVTPHIYDYYINSASIEGYAEFHYSFIFGDDVIDYKYKKDDSRKILFESLTLNGKLLFENTGVTHSTSGLLDIAPNLNWNNLDGDSMLRYIINNSMLDKNHPLNKMMTYVSNMLWFRSLDENRYIGYKSKSDDYYSFMFTDGVLEEFEEFLYHAGIEDRLIAKTDVDGVQRLYINGNTPLPFFKVASNGTKALYTFFYWYKTAKDVSLMFIDEFDAFYHYELAETIVNIVEKMPATQVVLTSHNTNLLSNKIMRPDCYFIMTNNSITSFANATDRELREGHNLEKLYMSGEFNE